MRAVALNLHPSTAAITLLPTPQVAIEVRLVDFQTCGQARQDRNQRLAVGFSGGEIAQHANLGLYPIGTQKKELARKLNEFRIELRSCLKGSVLLLKQVECPNITCAVHQS